MLAWYQDNLWVRVMKNDFQTLGDTSELATKAVLASNAHGTQHAFYKTLLASKNEVTKEEILRITGEVGLDAQRLEADMVNPELTKNLCWEKVPGTISLPIQPRSVVAGFRSPAPCRQPWLQLHALRGTVTDATHM